jgi:probable HAF family extracellular repeat protein
MGQTAEGQACDGPQELGTFGGVSSEALAVSADGRVIVGTALDGSYQWNAFRWTATTGMQYLATRSSTNKGWRATGVSADGTVIVGVAPGPRNRATAFRWTERDGMQLLGTLGGATSMALAVSADGRVVVGQSDVGYLCSPRPFRWTASEGMRDLGQISPGPCVGGTAHAVSADGGVIVGWALDTSVSIGGTLRAFRWTAAEGMKSLGTLGGNAETQQVEGAWGVSPDGSVVVGCSKNELGKNRAFRWTAGSGMQALDSLNPAGGTFITQANAISADGSVIVGKSFDVATLNYLVFSDRPVRWNRAGRVQVLERLPAFEGHWTATAISADGAVIVGTATRADGTTSAVRWNALLRRVDSLDSINESAHFTDRYSLNRPADNPRQRTILRRGGKSSSGSGTADIDVVVGECFDPTRHLLCLEAEHSFDRSAVVQDIPLFAFAVPVGQWGCTLREPLAAPVGGERVAKLRVFIPATAAIGQYHFRAVVKSLAGARLDEKSFARPVVLLFNPWDPNDETYLGNDAERVEYVLDESGLIWVGTARFNRADPWDFAQFEDDVFLVTLGLLDGLPEIRRSSPVFVSRWLTERLDSVDGGVLVGNWSGDYSGGLPPWHWTSSKQVFRHFLDNGPVRYGQCWVYGGLLTSSLRSIGIATRPVTNFESAHDTSRPPDRIIERRATFNRDSGHWDWAGESVWNFHVWCEAWMRRYGLPGRDGWQVVDATPQERSDGLFQLGPTPVSAVKEELPQPFDGAFVLSEVDSDVRHTVWDGAAWVDSMPVDTTMVGRRMSTKAVGTLDRVDITDTYKTPETTMDPRSWPEVEVDAPASLAMGQPIDAAVTIRNVDAVARDFTCYVLVRAVAQNGQELGVVAGPRTDPVTIPGGGMTNVAAGVTWNQLRPFLGLTEFIEFDVVVTRLHDEQRWFKQRVTVVRGLPVTIAVAPAGEVVQPGGVTVTVTCTNPLAEPLDAGTLTLTGGSALPIGGTARNEEIPVAALAPGASVSFTRELSAAVVGRQMIAARWLVPGRVPGDAVTDIAVLARCPADVNADGGIDGADIVDFFAAWEQGAPDGDFNADGGVDFNDVEAFFDRWESGC